VTELDALLAFVDSAYDVRSWHGPNLRGSLRGVTAAQAGWRIASGRHTIRELAIHAAYWKYVAARRLTGAKRGSFSLKGSNWFEREGQPTPAEWRADLQLLEESHRAFREVVASLAPRDLSRTPRGAEFNNFALVSGVAAHDLYHAGQIQLLKRMMKSH
jgi:uncharacterized damage-inducible protein DinB